VTVFERAFFVYRQGWPVIRLFRCASCEHRFDSLGDSQIDLFWFLMISRVSPAPDITILLLLLIIIIIIIIILIIIIITIIITI
jgi:hypothetical protein